MSSNKMVYAGWKVTEVPDILNGKNHFTYILGYPDGHIGPQNNVTSGEVAVIFYRLLKDDVRQETLGTTSGFSDVAEDSWYNTAISLLVNMGVFCLDWKTADLRRTVRLHELSLQPTAQDSTSVRSAVQ